MYQFQFNQVLSPRSRKFVVGGAETQLAVQEWGVASGKPIVFAHAFGTNHLAWKAQLTSNLADEFRLITFDHRGHGESQKPDDPAAYSTLDVWAEDFEAVLREVGEKAIVVAWSMSGSYLGDYLAKYGASRIAGINLVAASNTLGTPLFTQQAGAAFAGAQGMFADGLSEQMQAMRSVNRFLTAKPLDHETEMAALAWLMMLPLNARRVMLGRDADHRSHYGKANVPILVSHGKDDQIVIPKAAEMLKEVVPSATLSWYDQVGHAPHWEGWERFNDELTSFAKSVN